MWTAQKPNRLQQILMWYLGAMVWVDIAADYLRDNPYETTAGVNFFKARGM